MDYRVKINDIKKTNEYLDVTRELKAMEQECDIDTSSNSCA